RWGHSDRPSPASGLSHGGRSLEPAARCEDRCGRCVPGGATGTGDPPRRPWPGPGAVACDAAGVPTVDPRTRRPTAGSPSGGAGARPRPTYRAPMPSQRLPRRSGLAAVPYRPRRRPVPRDLAGPRAATRGRGARRRRGSAEHRLRHRHPCRGRRVRAGGALQLSLAHRPRPALRRSRPPTRRNGAPSWTRDGRTCPTTTPLPTCTSSRPRTAVHWTHPPRILSEHLAPLPEPLACLLTPEAIGPAPAVAAFGARALLDLTPLALEGNTPWPAWLAPHQVPAAERLIGILGRHGGALLADAVGLGKSYVALAVALALSEP